MNVAIIDIWNVETFDAELVAKLRSNADLIKRWVSPVENSATAERDARLRQYLAEELSIDMAERTIRGWHYTRLTDQEVEYINRTGIHPSSLDNIRARLITLVDAGIISAEQAGRLDVSSPFHKQNDIRANRFWMTSNPTPINSSGVKLLLGNWGGEGVYFWLEDEGLKNLVSKIGKARILELVVPLRVSPSHRLRAALGIMQTFGSSICPDVLLGAFDFAATEALGPEAVLAIHTEGDKQFALVGNGYPSEFRPELDPPLFR